MIDSIKTIFGSFTKLKSYKLLLYDIIHLMYTSFDRLKIEVEKGIPLEDRQAALTLLLELAIQRGTLRHILDVVLLLLKLSGIPDNLRNRNTDERVKEKLPVEFQASRAIVATETSYPLLPFLRRLGGVPTPSCPMSMERSGEALALSPTRSYLECLTLPNDDSTKIELRQVATVTLSHLDRIAEPYCSIDMVSLRMLCVCVDVVGLCVLFLVVLTWRVCVLCWCSFCVVSICCHGVLASCVCMYVDIMTSVHVLN